MRQGNEYRLILAAGIHEYGERTTRVQRSLREGLHEVMKTAADRAKLDRGAWVRQPWTDGELAILPPDTPEPSVIDTFVPQLNGTLLERNRPFAAEAWLRLRLAIHFGPANRHVAGFAGRGPVVTRWLCESETAAQVLNRSPAGLIVIISEQVLTDTIAQQLTALDERDLRKIVVKKNNAWLWTPDHRLDDLDLDDLGLDEADPPQPARPAQETQVPPAGTGPANEAHRETARNSYTAGRDFHKFDAGRDISIHYHDGGGT